jgi:hypothetical protein
MSISTTPPAPAENVTIDDVTCEVTEFRTVIDIHRDPPRYSGRRPEESWFTVSNLDSDGQRIGLQFQIQIADGGRKQRVRVPVTAAKFLSRGSSGLS